MTDLAGLDVKPEQSASLSTNTAADQLSPTKILRFQAWTVAIRAQRKDNFVRGLQLNYRLAHPLPSPPLSFHSVIHTKELVAKQQISRVEGKIIASKHDWPCQGIRGRKPIAAGKLDLFGNIRGEVRWWWSDRVGLWGGCCRSWGKTAATTGRESQATPNPSGDMQT